MFSLEIEVDGDRDLLIADLYELGACGIAEPDGHSIRAFFEDSIDREELLARFPGAAARVEAEHDWVQHARDLLQPAAVGKRFFLVPEWRDDPAPDGRFRIIVNPGMAFGTGVHETTQLCIEALEDLVRPGIDVLDVGTGSGILRQSARLLGVGHTYACDIDPDAVAIAGEAFVGSVDAVRRGAVDLAVANISPEAIGALAGDLVRVLRPGGALIASGFEKHELETVRAALPAGAELRTKGNWAALICRPSAGKTQIRAAAIERRDALPAERRRDLSNQIMRRVIELEEFRQARTVMAYMSFRSEVDTSALIEAALAAGKCLVLPRVAADRSGLELFEVTDLAAHLRPGVWGIREPHSEICTRCDIEKVDFTLVPGVAFDRQGGRIGYGRGHYDRLLGALPSRPTLVAAAFDTQIVDALPVEPHDVRVDILVTESGEWRFPLSAQ